MEPISVERLLRFAKANARRKFKTLAQGKEFTLRVEDNKIIFFPSSTGNAFRPGLEKYVDSFNRHGSLKPSAYPSHLRSRTYFVSLVGAMLKQSPSPRSTMNVWLFQAVPEDYDLTREVPLKIGSSTLDDWAASRYRNEMHAGDAVLFWQAGHLAGIYAKGRLSSRRHQVPYLNKDREWRVDVSYTQILPTPIFKEELRNIASLKQLSILRPPFRGTNFKVSRAQWKVLQKLILQENVNAAPPKKTFLENDSGRFDPENTKDARRRILISISERRGQPAFRQKLLTIFGGRCIITGCDVTDTLEAAHIIPYRGEHTNHPSNGLLLRADIHTLFDLQLIAIETKTLRLLVAPALKGSSYATLAGKRIRLSRTNGNDVARLQALDIHRAQFQVDRKAEDS